MISLRLDEFDLESSKGQSERRQNNGMARKAKCRVLRNYYTEWHSKQTRCVSCSLCENNMENKNCFVCIECSWVLFGSGYYSNTRCVYVWEHLLVCNRWKTEILWNFHWKSREITLHFRCENTMNDNMKQHSMHDPRMMPIIKRNSNSMEYNSAASWSLHSPNSLQCRQPPGHRWQV